MKDFWKSFLGSAMKLTCAFGGAGAVVAVLFGQASWVAGMVLCAVWLAFNSLLLFRVTEMVKAPVPATRRGIMILCMVKFPVLYLLGLGMLLLDWVDVRGVLVTFTIFLVVLPIVWTRHRPV